MKWLESILIPHTDWIQIEVSSCCNAECIYCPNTVYHREWLDWHMSLETFRRLIPALKKTQLTFLQGWGEPLLNPEFFQMVQTAKQAGSKVGTTTSGMLIDDDMIEPLIESGIDMIAFSIAGTDEENDSIRKGTQLSHIINTIKKLNLAKCKKNSSTPAIHIAYLLLRSQLTKIQKLPSLLEGLQVEQVVISTLDFISSPELESERIFPLTHDEFEQINELLSKVKEEGLHQGIQIHYYLAQPDTKLYVCTENIQDALFVSSDGSISPCVFYNLPVRNAFYYDGQGLKSYERMSFGNINDRSFLKIWDDDRYLRFRRSFDTLQYFDRCRGCPKRFEVLF